MYSKGFSRKACRSAYGRTYIRSLRSISVPAVEIPFKKSLSSSVNAFKTLEIIIKMVTDSVDAFVEHDVELAKKVVSDDDIVDKYFDLIKQEIIREITPNGFAK